MADLKAITGGFKPANTGQGILADFKADVGNALVNGMPFVDQGVGRVMKVYGVGQPLLILAAPAASFYGPLVAAESATKVGTSGTIVPENQRVIQQGIAQAQSHGGIASLAIATGGNDQTSDVAELAAQGKSGDNGALLRMPPMWARDP